MVYCIGLYIIIMRADGAVPTIKDWINLSHKIFLCQTQSQFDIPPLSEG